HQEPDEANEGGDPQSLDRPWTEPATVHHRAKPLHGGVALVTAEHRGEVLHHRSVRVHAGKGLEVFLAPFAEDEARRREGCKHRHRSYGSRKRMRARRRMEPPPSRDSAPSGLEVTA